jgi:ribosome maturation factor RimP
LNGPDVAAIAELLRPALTLTGVDLVDVQWKGGGRSGSVLRLIVDRPGGVDLDGCEQASVTASAILDAYDPIAPAYSLEVSSPGAERPVRTLDEWRAAVGRRVNVRYHSGDAEQIVEGHLISAGGETLEVEARTGGHRRQTVAVPVAAVIAARIVVDI